MDKQHFTIVIPAYNCERWAKRNILSAVKQEYDNFDVIYTSDASTDDTLNQVKEAIEDYSGDVKDNIRIFSNEENKKALYNIVRSVNESKPGTVIVTLDGDDWLPHQNVLDNLNEVYSDPEVWMTAGSYLDSYSGMVSSPNLSESYWDGNIRRHLWTISHLRTFRRKLFLKINIDDMLDRDGNLYKFTFDQAMMYPMAEMAGPKHFREIRDVLYIYNRLNPLSVDRVHRSDQLRIEQDIRNRKPYQRLEKLYE